MLSSYYITGPVSWITKGNFDLLIDYTLPVIMEAPSDPWGECDESDELAPPVSASTSQSAPKHALDASQQNSGSYGKGFEAEHSWMADESAYELEDPELKVRSSSWCGSCRCC